MGNAICREQGWTARSLLRWLALFLGMAGAQPVLAQPQELVLGVFPRQGAQLAHDQYGPIARHLSVALQRVVRLESAKDFDAFWKGIETQRYDLIHSNQYQYIKSHATAGYQVIVRNEEFGKATMAPALLIRTDSEITSVQQLKGKRVVFGGGRTAMVAYVGIKALLEDHGLPEGSYEEQVALNPLNAVIAVSLGQADAGGGGEAALNMAVSMRKVNVGEMKVLASGEELPHLPWAVRKGLDVATVEKIRSALLGLDGDEEGRKILAAAGVTRFLPARDEDYQGCRDLVRRVLKENY